MEKSKLRRKNVKKIIVAFLLVIALTFQISFLSYLVKAVSPNKNNENVVMTYTSNGNLDYKVYLKQNDFIDDEYLNDKDAYVLDLIDHVGITYLYNFKSDTKTSVTGTNKLITKLKVYYKESTDENNNPEVMKKEKTLDEKTMNFDDTNYNVKGTYDIYLDDYINLINEFQSQVKIAVDGYLEVSLVTDFSGNVGGASYNDDYTNTLKIPLSKSVIKIENNKEKAKQEKVYEGDLLKTNKTVMSYIVIANIITFIIICVLLKRLFTFTNKTSYERKINKILRNYDDIIVNTSNIIDVSKYKLIKIDEFKEILNLSRELLLPIMNYEKKKGKETWFYVIKDDILYMYVVSLDEEKKKDNKKNS